MYSYHHYYRVATVGILKCWIRIERSLSVSKLTSKCSQLDDLCLYSVCSRWLCIVYLIVVVFMIVVVLSSKILVT